MTPEQDPLLSAKIITWGINAFFAVALLVGRITYTRAMDKQDETERRSIKKQDETESRLRKLEKDSVTHDDLRRIETKIDEHNKQVTDRLDRILERGK